MADADVAVEFRVLIKHRSDVVHDRNYTLDLDAPNWEQFDLTHSELQRCETLLSAARAMWTDSERLTDPKDLSEPVRTLLEAVIETIGDALVRTVDSSSSLKSSATTV
ncbi:hypothetical protein [Candidatus Poriferisodalis sp.]|uniref:hypothetical protein n=1 Tax=Candidatus Poriferisodalis sp. TaxID=3101277 RepID=UPI003AF783B7